MCSRFSGSRFPPVSLTLSQSLSLSLSVSLILIEKRAREREEASQAEQEVGFSGPDKEIGLGVTARLDLCACSSRSY